MSQMSLNADAPVTSTPLAGPPQTLKDWIKKDYPSDGNNVYLHTFAMGEGAGMQLFTALHLLTGWKDVVESEMYLELVSVVIRLVPLEQTGVYMMAGLTVNSAANASPETIVGMKSMVSRRITDLSLGAETHELKMHTGMSSLVKPSNIAGMYPYLALYVNGSCTVTVEITYKRGAGSIRSDSTTMATTVANVRSSFPAATTTVRQTQGPAISDEENTLRVR